MYITNYKNYVPQILKNEIGKTTYTQMLNEDGGIETDQL